MSDIVSIHVNLNATTTRLLSRKEFSAMKPGSILINTSRGEVIDEPALLEALHAGTVSAAALDVLSGEQSGGMPDHPLVQYARQYHNLLITPHIGGCTVESMELTEYYMAQRLCQVLQRKEGARARPAHLAAVAGA